MEVSSHTRSADLNMTGHDLKLGVEDAAGAYKHVSRRASQSDLSYLATRNEEQFVTATPGLSIRDRAQLAPLTKSKWRKAPATFHGELFGLYSSFGNDDITSLGPVHRPKIGSDDTLDKRLRHAKREQEEAVAKIRVNERVVPVVHPAIVFDENPGRTATRWNGVRARHDQKFYCNGEIFPCDRFPPPKYDIPADALKPSRNPPLDRLRWPSASSPDANASPDQYGVLRLARSPTQSYTRQLQTKYLDEKYKHKRSKANMGR